MRKKQLEQKIKEIEDVIGIDEKDEREESLDNSYFPSLFYIYRKKCRLEKEIDKLSEKLDTLYKHLELNYIEKECKTNIIRKSIKKSKK